MHTAVNPAEDLNTLLALNREYIRCAVTSDASRFDEILADDFMCSLPDGSIVDRAQFLLNAARPATIADLQVHDVHVRLFGDTAIVHARTTFRMLDGKPATGRYTDVWIRQDGRWAAVAAHVTRHI